MTDEPLYTIGELAERAGVTPRTIRYYTAEGLLPRPDARGQYALYGAEHLLRLQLIARLKALYLPLGAIRAQIEHLSPEQLRAALAEAPAPAGPDTAAAYLERLLHRPPVRLAEQPARYEPASSPAPSFGLPRTQLGPTPSAAPAPVYGFAAPAPGLPEPAPEGTPAEPAERWRRITLASGVELHIREPAAPVLREAVDRLVAVARELFKRDARE